MVLEQRQSKPTWVISAGAWGTAIAKVIAENGHVVEIWDFMDDVVNDINNNHKNSRYLPGVALPKTLSATNKLEKAAEGKDFLVIAAPSLYILAIIKQLIHIPNILEGKTTIGVLTKGFIEAAGEPSLITPAIEDYLPGIYKGKVVYISGPSHAEEVARGRLTGLISASENGKNAIKFRELLNSNSLMVFPSLDIIGVQTAAAVKNVIAIAFGMLDALMAFSDLFGDNSESLLLAAGLNEIQKIGTALGSKHPETFTSIAGVGDLDVTCRSKYGRNRRFGREIITARKIVKYKNITDLIDHIDDIGYLPEGIVAARFVQQLADKRNLKLPVCSVVYKVLNRDTEPLDALTDMIRNLTGSSFSL